MKKILGADIGYGDCKIMFGTDDGEVISKFKFPTLVGLTKKIEHVTDDKIKEYKGHHYYIGEDATHLPSDLLIDISEYKNLEYFAPLLLNHAISKINDTPDIVVTGLSIAQVGNSGHFQGMLKDYTIDSVNTKFEHVFVLPQGAGSKICIDNYGNNFPIRQQDYLGQSTYVIVDIGFSTLDLVLVKDGEAKANLFEGIEKQGIMKIATKVAARVNKLHKRQITLGEAKDIIDTGVYKLRGTKHDFSAFIQDTKHAYLKELLDLINIKYPGILDKSDFISISGGGSTLFTQKKDDDFIRIPKSNHEFYNSIGFFEYGRAK